jgi:hypothetical protein
VTKGPRKPKVITLSSPYRLEWIKLALRKPPKPPKGKRDTYLCWIWPDKMAQLIVGRGYVIAEWDGKKFLINDAALGWDIVYWMAVPPPPTYAAKLRK